jgi:hypothetical protein
MTVTTYGERGFTEARLKEVAHHVFAWIDGDQQSILLSAPSSPVRFWPAPPLHSKRAINNLGVIQQIETPVTLHASHGLLGK